MTIYRGPGGTGESTSDADNTEFQAYVAQAVTAKDAAAGSATAASSSATSAATSATNASNSETSAASSASSASTSATNAAASATTASTQATNAAASATAAATSATNAAASATSAASSATSASGSASTATTKASEASTSATNAASSATSAAASATTATTQATNASSSASAAATSATSASNSASAASTSASAASTSASSAATSATNAASSATAAAGSATSASTSASTATTQASNASTSATNAAASATSASTSASTATTQASNASTSATNAATSATSAATSATSASVAQTAAESARDAALSAYDNFDDRYLGPKASDPTLDNDGNALLTGALYFNTTSSVMKVYTGTTWVAAYVSAAGVLLTANNLSDLNNVATARTNLGLGTAALVADSTLVHKTGDETVAGVKTFSSTIAGSVSGNAGTVTDGVYTTGDQTVAGVKTLSSNPILSAGTANGVPYLNGSKVLTSGSALVFDGTNLGLGATPSAWSLAGFKALEIGGAGSAIFAGALDQNLLTNAYYNAGWKYAGTGVAIRYQMNSGEHRWYNAPSGTAGNAITFTQAMTLSASGNLTSTGNIYANTSNLVLNAGNYTSYILGGTQTWQSPSRSASTTYQNTTGRSIQAIVMTNGAGTVYFQTSPDNSTWYNVGWATAGGGYHTTTIVVPNNHYYRMNGAATITAWTELR